MREILFRAKTKMIVGTYNCGKEDGEWVIGCLYCDVGKWIIRQFEFDRADYVGYEIDPETVGQYTGYKDDTGKRIFEGDIVGFEDITSTESGYSKSSCCGEVGYNEEEACFYVTDRLSAESWEVLGECHIVGNIFDNPELKE